MLTRKVKLQLVAFAVISVLAVAYALIRFTDVGEQVGRPTYTVRVELAGGGGLFPNAEVTYRGFNVGRVGAMRLTEPGIEVDLTIDGDAPQIPADVDAVVLNRSAIGEQFLDLRPRSSGGPYLAAGSVIPMDRTALPSGPHEVVEGLYQLAESVPIDALRTVVDESYDAFAGSGAELRALLVNARTITAAAREHVPQTVELLRSGGKLLRAVNDEMPAIVSFSENLDRLTGTLRSSDADIRRLVDRTPRAARAVSELLREAGPGVSALVANLITVGEIPGARLKGLEQALLTYPALGAGALAVTREGPFAPMGFALNLFDPPACYQGYEGTKRRPGDAMSPAPYNTEAYCAEPLGSPVNVRGSQRAPYHGVPAAPTPQQLEQHRDRDQETLREVRESAATRPPGFAGGTGASLTTFEQLLGLGG